MLGGSRLKSWSGANPAFVTPFAAGFCGNFMVLVDQYIIVPGNKKSFVKKWILLGESEERLGFFLEICFFLGNFLFSWNFLFFLNFFSEIRFFAKKKFFQKFKKTRFLKSKSGE